MAKPVRVTAYAKGKFVFLREHGFSVTEEVVRKTVSDPEHLSRGHGGRWVAQRALSVRHVLRVVYEDRPHEKVVITF